MSFLALSQLKHNLEGQPKGHCFAASWPGEQGGVKGGECNKAVSLGGTFGTETAALLMGEGAWAGL